MAFWRVGLCVFLIKMDVESTSCGNILRKYSHLYMKLKAHHSLIDFFLIFNYNLVIYFDEIKQNSSLRII